MVRTGRETVIFLHLLAELIVQALQYPIEFIKDIIKIQGRTVVSSMLLIDDTNFYDLSVSTSYISIK